MAEPPAPLPQQTAGGAAAAAATSRKSPSSVNDSAAAAPVDASSLLTTSGGRAVPQSPVAATPVGSPRPLVTSKVELPFVQPSSYLRPAKATSRTMTERQIQSPLDKEQLQALVSKTILSLFGSKSATLFWSSHAPKRGAGYRDLPCSRVGS